MRSIKTTVTAAAVLAVGFVLTAPAAQAATAPQAMGSSCPSAIHAAEKARHDFDVAVAEERARHRHYDADEEKARHDGEYGDSHEEHGEYGDSHEKKHMGYGEHHEKIKELLEKAKNTAFYAEEMCKGMHRHDHHPRGAMHTGVGSTSQGSNTGEIAGGVGLLGAAGAGALALRRRRRGAGASSES